MAWSHRFCRWSASPGHDATDSGAEHGAVVVATPVDEFDVAGVAPRDLAGKSEADAVPALFVGSGGDAFLEDLGADLVGDTVAAVDHGDEEVVTVGGE